jgi:hypothetical protein
MVRVSNLEFGTCFLHTVPYLSCEELMGAVFSLYLCVGCLYLRVFQSNPADLLLSPSPAQLFADEGLADGCTHGRSKLLRDDG